MKGNLMNKKEALGDEGIINQKEYQADDGIESFLEILVNLTKQYPKIKVENLVAQLASALPEDKVIELLQKIKELKEPIVDEKKLKKLLNEK